MPFRTPTYGLEAHISGESYSATIDRRRFSIIDNQMAFLSDLIGDGRISGWHVEVSDANSFELSISPGVGIINRFGI